MSDSKCPDCGTDWAYCAQGEYCPNKDCPPHAEAVRKQKLAEKLYTQADMDAVTKDRDVALDALAWMLQLYPPERDHMAWHDRLKCYGCGSFSEEKRAGTPCDPSTIQHKPDCPYAAAAALVAGRVSK